MPLYVCGGCGGDGGDDDDDDDVDDDNLHFIQNSPKMAQNTNTNKIEIFIVCWKSCFIRCLLY